MFFQITSKPVLATSSKPSSAKFFTTPPNPLPNTFSNAPFPILVVPPSAPLMASTPTSVPPLKSPYAVAFLISTPSFNASSTA